MAKKRAGYAFGNDPAEMDSATYGPLSGLDFEKIDSDKISIETIFIDQIEPDLRQPRRTMPTAIRKVYKTSDPSDMMYLFGTWIQMAEKETGEPFPMEYTLGSAGDGQDGGESEAEYFPVYYNLMLTAQLAASIRRDTLKNPITVYRVGEKYKIETGERRWLAYELLEYFYGTGQWEKIPAKVGTYDVWGQATENNQRSSLNAIGKARQFALLLMQLYPEAQWKTYEECKSDLEFYAQVADGDVWRIPRGKGGQLMNAMGEQNPVRLREYRTLLRLDQANWERADDGNWKLGAVLAFVRPPSHTVQIRTVSGDESPTPQNGEKGQGGHPEAAGEGLIQSSFPLPGEQRAQASGLYPSSTPVKPIGRGESPARPAPLFATFEFAAIKNSGAVVRLDRCEWLSGRNVWTYQPMGGGEWIAEDKLEKVTTRTLPPAQTIPTPSPSSEVEDEEDYEDNWVQKPIKSVEPLFDKNTLMFIRDLAKLTEQEIWQWVTTHGYGLDSFMAWHGKTEEAIAQALAWAEDTATRFDAEYKAQKREVSE